MNIQQLLQMHEQHYNTMKTALLKLQEEPKEECTKSVCELIQQIESKQQEPEKAEDECDWVAKGNHVLDTQPDKLEGDTKRTDNYIATCKKEWALAVAPNRHNPSESELMACIVSYIQNLENCTLKYKQNKGGMLGTTIKLLKLEKTDDWIVTTKKVENEVKALKYKPMPLEAAKAKWMCKDGTVLTIPKLRAFVKSQLDQKASAVPSYQLMLLSFFAYHGNRPEDWCIAYGIENGSPNEEGNISHYCPKTETMHIYKDGKCKKAYPTRIFKVHEQVARAICFHIAVDEPRNFLVYSNNDTAKARRKINDSLKRKEAGLFCEGDSKGFGFPDPIPTTDSQGKTKLIYITPTDLRHLFETHIRYSKDKIPKEERLELMKQIGHSDDVALSDYAQTYRPLVEWAEANEQ